MHSLAKLGALLAASATIIDAWGVQKYKTEKFQVPVFKTQSFKGGKTADGYLFLGMVHPSNEKEYGPIIVDNTGDLIWHGPSKYNSYYNFHPQTLGGKNVMTWWNGYLETHSGHGYGHVNFYDHTYNRVKKICFPSSVNIVTPKPDVFPGNTKNPCYIDKHESIATDRNSIIVTAYNVTQTDLTKFGGPANGWVYDCLFYELDLDTNDILFRWSSLENVPVTKSNYLAPGDDPLLINGRRLGSDRENPWDYFHINSVEAIPGGYIANSRMTWSFYKINGETGNIDWTLEGSNGGDFKLKDPIFFSWQHEPRVQMIREGGDHMHIHLFNNDNIPNVIQITNVSSAPMLDVDATSMEVRKIYNLVDKPNGGIYATAEGSQQHLANGHHLVGFGSQPFVEEFNGDNELVYFAQFGAENASLHSYRAYRSSWVGNPTTKPKVVAEKAKGGKFHTYMSWNGATKLHYWNVYAGKTAKKMKRVAHNVQRKSFETMVTNDIKNYKYVMVEALGKNKKRLSKSKPVAIKG